MDFFKPITNFLGNLFGGGGGQAAISSFQQPNTVQIPTIQQPGKQVITPSQTGASSPAFIGTQSGIGQPVSYSTQDVLGYDKGGFPIIKQGAQKVGTTTDIGNIRPLITTQPTTYPTPPTQPPIEAIKPVPGIENIKPYVPLLIPKPVINPATSTSTQQFIGGGGESSRGGTGAGLSFPGAVGGLGTPAIGTSQEEEQKQQKKQPGITVISAEQAQAAARSGQLFGSGTSGVFKDAQGNFYSVGNAQIANVFGAPNAQGRLDVTQQNLNLAPFRSSLETGPISAENLLKGSTSQNIIATPDVLQNNLQSEIDELKAATPQVNYPLTVDNPILDNAIQNSNDPNGLAAKADAIKIELGQDKVHADLIAKQEELNQLESGLQTIVKDIESNPDLPKGLAARMINDFTNRNAVNLNRLKGELQILTMRSNQIDQNVNERLGLAKYDIESQQKQQQQQKNDAQQNLQTLISSKAWADATDSDVENYAKATGMSASSLKAIRDKLKV